jgi:hypothetical protein
MPRIQYPASEIRASSYAVIPSEARDLRLLLNATNFRLTNLETVRQPFRLRPDQGSRRLGPRSSPLFRRGLEHPPPLQLLPHRFFKERTPSPPPHHSRNLSLQLLRQHDRAFFLQNRAPPARCSGFRVAISGKHRDRAARLGEPPFTGAKCAWQLWNRSKPHRVCIGAPLHHAPASQLHW